MKIRIYDPEREFKGHSEDCAICYEFLKKGDRIVNWGYWSGDLAHFGCADDWEPTDEQMCPSEWGPTIAERQAAAQRLK